MCCSGHSAKGVARMFARIGFGLALAFVGFAHYQDPTFAGQTALGLGVLSPLGMIWGYILPGLMILGGLLLAFGIYMEIAAYAAGLALASIPAGLMLKSAMTGVPLTDTMPYAINAFVWIIVLLMVVKGRCGMGMCGTGKAAGCMCGCGCCDDKGKKHAAMSAPAASASVKSAPKKKVAKKASKKK